MKVYVTKYALSGGISEIDAEPVGNGMVLVRGDHSQGTFDNYYHATDWYQDRDAAIARAKEMRDKKIASVKKQLAKLEAMTF